MPDAAAVVRLAHLSDVHITTAPLGWGWRDWCSKRVTGWINTHWRSRRWQFRDSAITLALIVADLRDRRPDTIVFSGDATMLGFPSEIARAADIFGVGRPDIPPGFAVPGNHDYYTPAAERSGAFERCFAPWLEGDRIDGETYPFARRVGSIWLVGVNSALGHVMPADASGEVGAAQLQRLERLLAELPAGPRILVTHYPVARPDYEPEKSSHALRNLDSLLAVAAGGGVRLWLHGHRHEWYLLDGSPPRVPFPVICAGSATEAGIGGYNEYTITGTRLRFVRRSIHSESHTFRDEPPRELDLGEV